jgi:hypothetical protein
VIYTLCDLLEHVYKKFMAADISTQTAKSIIKLDTRFKVWPLSHTVASGRALISRSFHSLARTRFVCVCVCACVRVCVWVCASIIC